MYAVTAWKPSGNLAGLAICLPSAERVASIQQSYGAEGEIRSSGDPLGRGTSTHDCGGALTSLLTYSYPAAARPDDTIDDAVALRICASTEQ